MRHRSALPASVLLLLPTLTLGGNATGDTRTLTLADRVQCQEAIERVYFSHQIAATRPFGEVVPAALVERKVRAHLKQGAALEGLWRSPVSGPALRAELERIARDTRFPQRLSEIYAALGEDPFLVEECFARPLLVDRLARGFFAFDQRIHEEVRREAEELRARLASRERGLDETDPRREVVEVSEDDARAAKGSGHADAGPDVDVRQGHGRAVRLHPEQFRALRSSLPEHVGELGPVEEVQDAFLVRALLSESDGAVRVATWRVPKRSWDSWWSEAEGDWDEAAVRAVSLAGREPGALSSPLPLAAGEGATSCVPDGTWENRRLDDAQPSRSDHAAVWTGSIMLVWGGKDDTFDETSSGARYDPLTDTWSAMSLAGAPAARYDPTAVWTGSEMIVWGGRLTTTATPVAGGGRYDPASDAWSAVSSVAAPTGRYGHTAVWTGTRMILWGGFDALNGTQGTSTGARYDPATDTWTPMATLDAPSPRADHSVVWTGSRMIVFGGRYYLPPPFTVPQVLATGGEYDAMHDAWSPLPLSGGPAARYDHSAIWTGNRMVIWGGRNASSSFSDGRRYNPQNDTWSSVAAIGAPEARSRHSALWTGSRMLVWGGEGATFLATGGRYDPVADAWSPISTLNAPAARAGAPMVWTGSLAVFWGGGGWQPLRSGGRYDPVADAWTAVGPENVPSARFAQASVWTGNLFIVWGGILTAGGSTSTGGRYDPLTDTWTPTATSGAPSWEGDRVVWSGEEMLAWQGGGRYNPIADTWSPISSVDAPADRSGYSVIWSGRYMIVWGGIAGGVENFNTGGRYDPRTDTWLPTSTINAPSRRQDHLAVWTGTRMIVWGGSNGRTYEIYGTGGAYDPEANAWTAISAANAPSPRSSPQAVWMGDRMFVWGGYGSGWPETGGVYDPAADAWTATSTLGAPTGRYFHTTTWTNGKVVVWGGYGSEPGPNGTGGRYDPATDAWEEVTASGAPAPRSDHSAAWTGDALLVWGGINRESNEIFGGGGRYLVGQVADFDQDGATLCGGDCDDADAARHPGAAETCNGIDDDCDGSLPANEADGDGDGAPACGDCDDAEPLSHPGAPEVCDDLDNDCDGVRDSFMSACGTGQCMGTGFCSGGMIGSCVVPAVPSPEICDGVDNNCDGVLPASERDLDGDGFAICQGDCSDTEDATYPGAPEQNDHGDNQCPGDLGYGLVDEITGGPTFVLPPETGEFCWPPQIAATRYEVSRSALPSVAAPCATWTTAQSCIADPEVPPSGAAFYYLIQATRPFAGSMGARALGQERATVCGKENDCDDYSDNDGDGLENCSDPDCFTKGPCDIVWFFFQDTAGDDVATTAFAQMLAAIPSDPSHYLSLNVSLPSFPTVEFCLARADWYRDRYLELAPTAGAATSGTWDKWYRTGDGPWIGPDTSAHENWFGGECSDAYSWCAEPYLGGHVPGMAPGATGLCEAFDTIDCEDGTSLWLQIGETRYAACGF